MKGIICCYSGSGNTRLACEYLRKKIKNARFELFDIVKNDPPDFSAYDFAGFATFTDFGAPSRCMYSFVEKIGPPKGMNAFVFNTFGFVSYKTLQSLRDLVASAGFNVMAGFSLHTPESYPPMRKKGKDFDSAPFPDEVKAFDAFIAGLDGMIGDMAAGKVAAGGKLKPSLLMKALPGFSRRKAKSDFGIQNVNAELCTECGVCMKGCPYGAIAMDPKPVFDHDKCHGCWYCYNHCKQKAVYTKKFNGEHQYPRPSDEFKKKMKVV